MSRLRTLWRDYPLTRLFLSLAALLAAVAAVQVRNTVRINDLLARHEYEMEMTDLRTCVQRNDTRAVVAEVVRGVLTNPDLAPSRRAVYQGFLDGTLRLENCAGATP